MATPPGVATADRRTFPGMIDLHNHILPQADDGAADWEESIAIARQFVSEGVERIATTPHLDPENRRGLVGSAVRERVARLDAILRAADVSLAVVAGQEIYLTPELPALLRAGDAIPLGNSPAVLVELSLTAAERPLHLEHTLFQTQLQGYQPVLAHPERYHFVQRAPAALAELIQRGVAMQLTAPSLAGYYGGRIRKTARRLLADGAYALAASDRHHPGAERSLAALHGQLVEIGGNDLADLLLRDNPSRLLAGDELERPPGMPKGQRSFFDRFSRG